jgi:hypothetical protein
LYIKFRENIGSTHFHAAPGTYKGDLLIDGRLLYQAQGAKILATIDATNGVVHVVDQVLLPPEKNPNP